jgi:2-polyprenyl-3-methyl-5-hydroxy-6-metoxy-1,4-benzoquinol methylase
MRRQFDPALPEWMDRPQPVSTALDRDLANLRSLNRWFGSYRVVRHFLARWLKPNRLARIADLATGAGDIPCTIVEWARARKIRLRIDAIDQQPGTVAIARRLSASYPEIDFVNENLLEWNPAESYDIVLLSLALHHFSDNDAVEVLCRCRELSRGAVLVTDLRRARWLSAGIYLLTAMIYREPMTKNDARVSAARAFSFCEMRQIAERAGWENFGHKRFAVGRQAIWLDPSENNRNT